MLFKLLRLIILLIVTITIISVNCKKTEEYKLNNKELEDKISLRVLKFGNPNSKPIKIGNKVQIKLKSFSPHLKWDITGEATQTFEVGKHNIVPLNEAMLDMRIGEIRRLGVPISSFGKIYYEFSLINVYPEREL